VQSQRGGLFPVRAGAAVSDRLRALARREGGTMFMAVLAVLGIVLQRFTGRERFLIGSNGANRPRPELEPVAGFFLNQIPFAVDLSGDPTFRELLGQARRTTAAATRSSR
jgi:non-ribosomal peptide synthetase component F